jgi:hypothetical protein
MDTIVIVISIEKVVLVSMLILYNVVLVTMVSLFNIVLATNVKVALFEVMFSLCYFYLFFVYYNLNSRCSLCRLTITRRVSQEL